MSVSQQNVSNKKILVIEDNPVERLGLARLLEQSGYTVAATRDAVGAMEAVRAGQPDLVLLDINLPVHSVESPAWDGLDFVEWMNGMTTADVPVIIRSNLPLAEFKKRGPYPQVEAFFQKGGNPREMLSAIASALDRQT